MNEKVVGGPPAEEKAEEKGNRHTKEGDGGGRTAEALHQFDVGLQAGYEKEEEHAKPRNDLQEVILSCVRWEDRPEESGRKGTEEGRTEEHPAEELANDRGLADSLDHFSGSSGDNKKKDKLKKKIEKACLSERRDDVHKQQYMRSRGECQGACSDFS